jgi:hypothetical protein
MATIAPALAPTVSRMDRGGRLPDQALRQARCCELSAKPPGISVWTEERESVESGRVLTTTERYTPLFQISIRVHLQSLFRASGRRMITMTEIDDATLDGFAE